MKVLEINTVCDRGSVGRIAVDIYRILEDLGDECQIAYGRGSAPDGVDAFCNGSWLGTGLHVLRTFVTGGHGFGSTRATRHLIEQIREWDPDIIHLHNIHGFVLQVELLFQYLHECGKPVVWTLHDCWSYTGHCAYYDYNACDGWKKGCTSCKEYRRTYPYALLGCNTAENYRRKQAAFCGVPNLTLVVPSQWLAAEVAQSFLQDYPVRVIPNGVNQSVFYPRPQGETAMLREQLGLCDDQFVVLGVANVWERRKGLEYFVQLAQTLPENARIVLIGLSEKQRRNLPSRIIGLGRTANASELACYYSMADVFVNATLEDNFPTTNLESLSCGTPVITFDTGGSPESLDETCGRVVLRGNLAALCEAILEEQRSPLRSADCLARATTYERRACYMHYVTLYRELLHMYIGAIWRQIDIKSLG